MGFLPPSLRPLINALQSEVDTHEALTTTAHGGLDASGSAAAAQAAAQSYADDLWFLTIAQNAASYITSETRTDYTEDAGAAGFIRIQADVLWPDGATGHLDGVEYGSAPGVLQYYTASHSTSGKIIVQAPLVAGVPSFSIIEPDYYVDSTAAGGGDGSLASPFNELADLSLSEDDIVALISGSHFDETLTLPEGGQVYRFGAGERPVIDAGNEFSAGSWALSTGASNAYEQTVTVELDSLKSWINVTENGVFLERVADAPTCDSTPGSYAVTADTGAGETSVTIWIHPSDSSNPQSNGNEYRHTRRLYSIIRETNTNNHVVDGLVALMQGWNNGVHLGDNTIVRNSDSNYGGFHNWVVQTGSSMLNCRAYEGYKGSSTFSLYALNEDSPSGEDSVFGECVAECSEQTQLGDAFLSHNNVSGQFGHVEMRRWYVKRLYAAFKSVADAATVLHSRCVSVECVRAINITSGSSPVINAFEDCYFDCSEGQIGATSSSLAFEMRLQRCKFVFTGDTVQYALLLRCDTNLIEDCEFVVDTQTGGSRIAVNVSDADVDFTINDCSFNDDWSLYFNVTNFSSYAGSGNCFEVDKAGFKYLTTTHDLAGWQTASGQDADSTIGGCF